ncbi:MAG: hypothetical protein Q4C30_08550, partial [Bacteroidia bacterium]|nr:hypothetical protein [Bacteroidia bacterium]
AVSNMLFNTLEKFNNIDKKLIDKLNLRFLDNPILMSDDILDRANKLFVKFGLSEISKARDNENFSWSDNLLPF